LPTATDIVNNQQNPAILPGSDNIPMIDITNEQTYSLAQAAKLDIFPRRRNGKSPAVQTLASSVSVVEDPISGHNATCQSDCTAQTHCRCTRSLCPSTQAMNSVGKVGAVTESSWNAWDEHH
jgi:hypothetical protein